MALSFRIYSLVLAHAIDATRRFHWVWAVYFFNQLQVVRRYRVPNLCQVLNKIRTSVWREYFAYGSA